MSGSPRASAAPAIEQVEDEAALVAAAKRERAAFAPLYARYFDPVYQYCYRRLGHPDAAADATSQVFAKALAAIGSCRNESFRSWLFAIAHNVLTDELRARRPEAPLEAAAHLADRGPTPEEQALAGEANRSLRALLAHLPPDQRSVIELRLAGLTGAEIARALGRSRGAVDVAQFRAVARLRRLTGLEAEARDAAT